MSAGWPRGLGGVMADRFPTSLIGRAPELDVLRAAMERAEAGASAFVVLEGEPGVGKSRLVAEGLQLARECGLAVRYGVCDEIEQDRPLRVVIEALGLEREAI